MIAVTFAVPDESRGFLRALGNRSENISVLHTGVGEKICRERIERFLELNRFEFLISSGFAGGIDPIMHVGDLLLAENFSDAKLLNRARDLVRAHVGRLVTAHAVIESASDREQFGRQNGASAVDMETEFIARACAVRDVPMLSLRAISDTAAAPFPAPPSILFDLQRQKTDARRLALYLVSHPSSVVRLIKFGRQIAMARASLTNALIALVRAPLSSRAK